MSSFYLSFKTVNLYFVLEQWLSTLVLINITFWICEKFNIQSGSDGLTWTRIETQPLLFFFSSQIIRRGSPVWGPLSRRSELLVLIPLGTWLKCRFRFCISDLPADSFCRSDLTKYKAVESMSSDDFVPLSVGLFLSKAFLFYWFSLLELS